MEELFYPILVVYSNVINEKGVNYEICRFRAVGAKRVVISRNLRTFIYFNPVKQTFDIHEELCGLLIESGKTESEAEDNVRKFLKEANEKMFFIQARAFGPSVRRTEISWDKAMSHFTAGLPLKPQKSNGH